ncbi:MAG: hypothetical protein HYW90_02300 [Candidatus Sungbacteria bacterium]|nr:hypothetical protein [Candidatus Sungbacteria bacterium]
MAKRRHREPIDPAAEEAYRQYLFRVIDEKAVERDRIAATSGKPPKPTTESPATDISLFGLIAVLGTIGAAVITIITAQERPGALIPIWLFFEGPMFLSLGLAANQIFVKPQPPAHSAPIRWFTAYGMFTAVANALVALLTGITRVVSG